MAILTRPTYAYQWAGRKQRRPKILASVPHGIRAIPIFSVGGSAPPPSAVWSAGEQLSLMTAGRRRRSAGRQAFHPRLSGSAVVRGRSVGAARRQHPALPAGCRPTRRVGSDICQSGGGAAELAGADRGAAEPEGPD